MTEAESPVDPVLAEVGEDRVAVVTLNRPHRRNGWNPVMEQRYFEVLESLDADRRVRAVVVTGAGTTFCPGVDSDRLDDIAGKPLQLAQRRSPMTPWAIRKPMIAAVNGGCAGMGLMQALLCDIRIAATGVRFSTSFTRRGLVAEFGISWLLPRIIGFSAATDLLLSGRVFDADEALAFGMINRVVPAADLLATARAYAADLVANCSPASMAMVRRQLQADAHSHLTDALTRTYRAMNDAATRPDFREGIDSFLQKRPPTFPDLEASWDPAQVTGFDLEAMLIPPAELVDREISS